MIKMIKLFEFILIGSTSLINLWKSICRDMVSVIEQSSEEFIDQRNDNMLQARKLFKPVLL